MKKILVFIGLFLSLYGEAQTYTFECVSGARLTGDSCDICPNTIVESRSFNGLVIFRNGDFYRWLDQPYSIRVKPGGIIEYWEHSVNPYSERVTIPLSLTVFSTIQGMADSTWCNSPGPQRYQELSLDSLSATLAKGRLSGSNTGIGLRAGSGITFDFQNDTLEIIGGGIPDANNGISNNEDGGKIRLGNRYMGTPDAPFTMARKINVDGRLLHIGDLSDSTLFVVDGATDRIGIRTDAPAKDLHVNGEARISDLINGTPDRVVGANSSGDLSRLYLSGMSVLSGVLTATDSSTANEIQTIDTFTIVSNVLRLSLSNDGQPFKSVDLSPYVPTGTVTSVATTAPAAGFTISGGPITTSGTFLFTLANDLAALEAISGTGIAVRTASETWTTRSIAASTGISVANGDGVAGNPTITNTAPDQVVSITGAGINVTSGTYPTFTITGTELDGSTTNELQIIANTNDATSHTATLSNSGGSLKIAEGTGITIATTGTGLDGVATVTNSAPDQTVSITGAGINVVTGTYPNFTVTGTEVGNGTVTNFSAGDLSPLFTTTEATTTTTPALTFSLNTQTANTVFSGPASGGAAAPTFRALVLADVLGLNTANNGLSDNEAGGGVFRLGNRYMNGSDGLFSFDRKINVNANKLFIGDNTDSTLLHIDGTNDRVGIHTNAPGRTFVVNGEVEIKDLVTTTPTLIVGADGNGVLSEITVSTGLSLSGGLLTSTGGNFYQTFRDDGTGMTQQAAANFVASGRISTTLTNDAGNGETEVLMDVVANSIANTHIRQGLARSVIGVTGNATANVADIQGTADQVLRVTTAGTALSFGTVATGGIADDAVTYAKLQNVAANNVLIGNDNGAGQNAQELTVAEVYTLLGMTGVDTRIAVWKGANTLGNDAGLVFDYTNDRQTITCTTPTFGAGTAILNVTNVGTDGTAEFIQSRGNIDGNLICNQTNLSSTASSNSFYQIQQQGDASGDAFLQFATLGAGGITHSIGLDNTDNRFKLTPNATTPGGNVNMGIILRDNAGIGNTGINKDFPGHPLDGLGRAAFELWQGGAGNQWTFGANVAYGAGSGTGPSGTTVVGHGNSVRLNFSTGTTPTLDGDVLILTYPFSFTTTSIVTFSARNSDATQPDFYISAESNTGCTLKVRGTLTASTAYHINFHIWGY